MSYGPDLAECFERAVALADRILKGATPGELPLEQPTRYKLAINVKTAKALGLEIPQSVMARADTVIEREARPTPGEAAGVARSSMASNSTGCAYLRLGRNGWRKPGRQIRTILCVGAIGRPEPRVRQS